MRCSHNAKDRKYKSDVFGRQPKIVHLNYKEGGMNEWTFRKYRETEEGKERDLAYNSG